MADYISREAALEQCYPGSDEYCFILALPAADVRPVVRGEWKPTGAGCLTSKCSVCGNKSIETGNFCPNCGADLREPPKEGET